MKPVNPDEFHAHLDVCKRCREQPFSLCPIGAVVLTKVFGNETETLYDQTAPSRERAKRPY